MWDKGYVQVYTGNGKGKTTAALGLALRAVGRGLNVHMIQFMKHWGYGEHLAAKRLAPEFQIVQVGKPYFVAKAGEISDELLEQLGDGVRVFQPGEPPEELLDLAQQGLEMAHAALQDPTIHIVILDEINVAMSFGLLSVDEVLRLIDEKPLATELILTGRNAPPEIMEQADLVTEMKEVKHYFTRGVSARRGIEE